MWPLGFSRVDLATWGAAIVVGVIATLLADLGGARLGAALTLGVCLMLLIVAGAMAADARGRSFRDDD